MKLPAFFQRFQTKVRSLRVNEHKITIKNAFNRDHFEIKGDHESTNDKKTCLGYFADLRPVL